MQGKIKDIEVVVPLYDQLDLTRECVRGLREDPAGPGRIILVDNGSTDGTVEFLRGLSFVTAVENGRNLGVAAAWNAGVKLSAAPWILILNNDTVLPPGWLRGLLDFCVKTGARVASPSMREGELNYDLVSYASEFVRRMDRQARWGSADGPAFLVGREVFDRVGLFDEGFFPAAYEDLDFFRRAKTAGFLLGVTGASFIHHYGAVTQRTMIAGGGEDHRQRNRDLLCRKWGLSHPEGGWWERRRNRLRRSWYRKKERILCGHTVKEKWIDGRLVYC
jgi:GT2 family glycosyltransferase